MVDVRFERASGLVNGTNLEFYASVPYAPGTVTVFVNGIALLPDNEDGFSETGGGGILMKQAPLTGDIVQMSYAPLE